jgi:hypothetical protein
MNSLLNEEVNRMRSMMGLSENIINEDYEYEKSEIEKASGDKVVQREFDDYDRPLFWSLTDDNVNYFIGDGENGKVIIKYNAETGQSDVIGDIQYEGEGPEMNEDLSNRTGDLYMEINDLIDEKYKDVDLNDIADVLENILTAVKAQSYREKNNIGPVTADQVKKNWGVNEMDENSINNDTIGIVSFRGKVMPAYFKNDNLASVGDSVEFDKSGHLLKQGGGYPEGGFKTYGSADELEADICKNYKELLQFFKSKAPVDVDLEEGNGAYEILMKSVSCGL